ncbi:hypothetical protein D3C71_861670 [compost metagenome]
MRLRQDGCIGGFDELGNTRRRQRNVVLDGLAFGALRFGDVLAQRPQGLQLRQAGRQRCVCDQGLLERSLQQRLHAGRGLRVVQLSGQLQQHVPRAAFSERNAASRHMFLDQLQAGVAHQLEGGERCPQARLCEGQQLDRWGGCRHRHACDDLGPGLGEELQGGAGDDAERAFAADVQVAQVVAGVVLAQAAQPVPDLAFGRHHFQAQRQVARVAVAQHLRAAGIGSQVAANGATAFGGQAQGEQAVGARGGFLHRLQDAARFHGDGVVVGVQVAHRGQAGRGQHHGAAGVVGRGATAQARVAALRHHRHAMVQAELHGVGHFLRGTRPYHRQRRPTVTAAPVQHIRRGVLAGQHMGKAQEGL